MLGSAGITNIRFKIGQPVEANSNFTDVQVLTELNAAVKDVARALKYPTRITTISGGSVAQQQEYDLEDRTLEVIEVTYNSVVIENQPWREAKLKTGNADGVVVYATPSSYYLVSKTKIGFIDIPAESGDVILVLNSYEPADIISTENIPYNEENLCELVCLRATIRLLQPQAKDEAAFWMPQYSEALSSAQIDVKNREGVDYVRNMDYE